MPQSKEAAGVLTRTRTALPAEVFPAIGYASLARGYLKSAQGLEDPYHEQITRAPLGQNARLTWASLTGRV